MRKFTFRGKKMRFNKNGLFFEFLINFSYENFRKKFHIKITYENGNSNLKRMQMPVQIKIHNHGLCPC